MDARRDIGGFVVWDYVVFAGMLLISAAIGIYYAFAGGGQQTSKDFLMGGRSMTAVPVAMSLTASFMSAVTVLGTPSEVYRFGAVFSVFAISYFLVVLISAEVFLPVFYKLGITSTYEYLELRFNRCIRLCGTVLFIVQTILYTGIVIYAPALALNQVTGFDLWGAVVATGVVCTFYCTLGGLKAVVWTDVFQVGIMVAGFASVIIQATVTQGGISKIIDDAYNGGRLNFWKSLYINLVGLWVILTCSVLCGLALYSRYRECDPWTSKKVSEADQLMPYLVLDILQDFPGVPGLFVACAYSGTLSTVSSSINALAAVTVEDLIKPHFTSLSERSLSWVSQGMSVLFGALCIGMAALASLMGALLQAALSIFGMIGGPLLGLFSLGILVPFANSLGALSGLLAGFAMSLWVGIGAQLYPPLPERTMPLSLETYGCNSTYNGTDLMTTTEMPFYTSAFEIRNIERTPLMDNWYSLSYLYFSTIGTLTALLVGIFISLSTGGRKQNLDSRVLLTKEDFLSNFNFLKKQHHDLSYKSHPVEDGGTDNPAFNHMELNFTDQNAKANGTRL
ncbi:PREDICTED: sodium-coupled monocarboxylate transporter 1 isoform X2 [Dipodomys ordii]|uniref:Sodium-coupled monocarboxylate transporter 1 isoform X2 n=1 Tax=Dipodomys ordii TaxID=10020 RepID=A0A1S3FPP4_DIPOR|nr:PREDICTED: sodium-coupled monocarboxylate transporter 1 isoform X2 [Dipodomys ordii]